MMDRPSGFSQAALLLLFSCGASCGPVIEVTDAHPLPAHLLKRRGQVSTLRRGDLQFELFLPEAWDPAASAPVLVFLHGRGESGGFDVTNAQSLPLQLLTNKSFAATFPFIAVIPQCPAQCAHANYWLPTTLQSITALLREWVLSDGPQQPRLGGDRARVHLAGQSMGGHGAWLYAAQQPRLFAAVVVVCGYAQGHREAKTFAERLARSRSAVAIYHSEDDSVIPVQSSDAMAAALKAAGYDADGGNASPGSGRLPLKYVRYLQAPGPPMPEFAHLIGHGSYELAFRDAGLYSWLLSQSCQRCSVRPPAPWLPLHAGAATEELRVR